MSKLFLNNKRARNRNYHHFNQIYNILRSSCHTILKKIQIYGWIDSMIIIMMMMMTPWRIETEQTTLKNVLSVCMYGAFTYTKNIHTSLIIKHHYYYQQTKSSPSTIQTNQPFIPPSIHLHTIQNRKFKNKRRKKGQIFVVFTNTKRITIVIIITI